MKRALLVAILVLVAATGFSQIDQLKTIASGLQTFTNAMATSIPLNSTTGNIWSDAYIGQLIAVPPHFGVGATAAITCIPGDYLNTLTTAISGAVSPEELGLPSYLASFGVPIPAAVANARVGGFILPFDVGVKFGYLPDEAKALLSGAGLNVSYLLAGADVRYALLNEKKNFIDLSVGVSLNYLSSTMTIPTKMGATDYTFVLPDSSTHTLRMAEPQIYLGWSCLAADVTAQVSKRILFLTPYLGVGATFGRPSVTTGIQSALTYDGAAMTDAQMSALQTLYDNLVTMGLPAPVNPSTLKEGYLFQSDVSGGTDLRVYGGFSLDILVVSLDINALYSFIGKNYGANVGLRVQL